MHCSLKGNEKRCLPVLATNSQLQSLVDARLSGVEARLEYLGHLRQILRETGLRDASEEEDARPGEKRRHRHPYPHTVLGVETSSRDAHHALSSSSSSSACSSERLCGYPRYPLCVSLRSIFETSPIYRDPFRNAGALVATSSLAVLFAPVPLTKEASRQREVNACYRTDVWAFGRSSTVSLPNGSKAGPQVPNRLRTRHITRDGTAQQILQACQQPRQRYSFIRVPSVKAGQSMQLAISRADEIGAPVGDVVAAHWSDLAHLRHYLCEYLLRVYQLHYPEAQWAVQFASLLNLPIRGDAVSREEERIRFRALVLCDERDLVERSDLSAQLLMLSTVHTTLHSAAKAPHMRETMMALLSSVLITGRTAIPYLWEKCVQLSLVT